MTQILLMKWIGEKMTVRVFDDIISQEQHKAVYDWSQTVSWYQTERLDRKEENEYKPYEQGKTQYRHFYKISGDEPFPLKKISNRFTYSMYRHPIAWSDDSTKERNPIIYDLWTKINNHVFDGAGTIDGLGEGIAGLHGRKEKFDNKNNFWDKNTDIPQELVGQPDIWTCMLNARPVEMFKRILEINGGIHRDSGDKIPEGYNYYTVLFNSSLDWRPSWGGEIVFYGDEYTGDKHWKRDYNLGYPDTIIGHKPNRIVVYPHTKLHMTNGATETAPEMAQKIAFRVRLKK
jgi:hypothetical protein